MDEDILPEKAPSAAAGTAPPWLNEARAIFDKEVFESGIAGNVENGLRAVLVFAARQRRPITRTMVLAAAIEVADKRHTGWSAPDIARAALEAAEKER